MVKENAAKDENDPIEAEAEIRDVFASGLAKCLYPQTNEERAIEFTQNI